MLKRLQSYVKYKMFEGHGNATIPRKAYVEAFNKAAADKRTAKQEMRLENCAYLGESVVEKDKVVPDFGIPSEQLSADTTLRFLPASSGA